MREHTIGTWPLHTFTSNFVSMAHQVSSACPESFRFKWILLYLSLPSLFFDHWTTKSCTIWQQRFLHLQTRLTLLHIKTHNSAPSSFSFWKPFMLKLIQFYPARLWAQIAVTKLDTEDVLYMTMHLTADPQGWLEQSQVTSVAENQIDVL